MPGSQELREISLFLLKKTQQKAWGDQTAASSEGQRKGSCPPPLPRLEEQSMWKGQEWFEGQGGAGRAAPAG